MPGRTRRISWAVSGLLLSACGDGGSADEGTDPTNDPGDCSQATETLDDYLIIESEDDLAGLAGIRVITGALQVDKTTFADLSALACLEEVGDDLTIFGNTELSDVSGLSALQRVGGSLVFSENTALRQFDGAGSLEFVGGSVVIQGNAAMEGIDGLGSLATIEGALNIRSNAELTHIDGLQGLRTVGGQLAITQNPNLCISSINRVGGGITDPAVIPDNWSTRSNDDSC